MLNRDRKDRRGFVVPVNLPLKLYTAAALAVVDRAKESCSLVSEAESEFLSFNEKVPRRTIEARKRRLMKLQQKISKQAKQEWIGREVVVLVEGESEETPLLWEGRTQFHAPEIDGKVYINDFGDLETLEAGRFYKAEITEAHEYDFVTKIIAGPLLADLEIKPVLGKSAQANHVQR